MNNKYILLWLEGPLQSWGADSKFGRRDTLPFPTRSGVMGLLLCALGASGEQKELLDRMARFRQTVISYARIQEYKNRPSEKKEREPLLMDFHMVGSGYNDNDPWETLLIPKTSEGKKAVGGGAKMTYRYYLQDAKFAVVIEIPDDLTESFVYALQHPVYDLYLGRKNCVATEFIYQGMFQDEELAFSHADILMKGKNLIQDFKVLEGEHEGDMNMTINDIPIQFGPNKKYRERILTLVYL